MKNGDQWIVTATCDDGSLRARRTAGGATAVLPTGYVTDHVELGYATTAHRAQGRTLDTAHAFVTATTVREPLYVMATRGRESNLMYVDTRYDPDAETSHQEPVEVQAIDVLKHVLSHSGADTSATQTRAEQAANSDNPTRLEAEGAAIHAHAREQRYTNLLISAGLPLPEIEAAKDADHWRRLVHRLHDAERHGLDLDRAIPRMLRPDSTGRNAFESGGRAIALELSLLQWANARPPSTPPTLLRRHLGITAER